MRYTEVYTKIQFDANFSELKSVFDWASQRPSKFFDTEYYFF